MSEFAGSQYVIEVVYLVASALFILSLKWMSSPTTARHGILAGEIGVALVGTAEFYLRTPHVEKFMMSVLSMEVILGGLTFTGSLMAAGKLQEILPQRPITYKGQNLVNLLLFLVAVGSSVYLVLHPEAKMFFPLIVGVSLIFGVLLVIPIGGADMPTVISLLNGYAGLSAAAMGFVLDSKLLIIAGALDGSSGLILSIIMS